MALIHTVIRDAVAIAGECGGSAGELWAEYNIRSVDSLMWALNQHAINSRSSQPSSSQCHRIHPFPSISHRMFADITPYQQHTLSARCVVSVPKSRYLSIVRKQLLTTLRTPILYQLRSE